MSIMDGIETNITGTRSAGRRIALAVVGGGTRAASMLRLMHDLETVKIAAVCAPQPGAAAIRMADELGIYTTTDLTEVFQVPGLDLVLDMSGDARVTSMLEAQRPRDLSVVGTAGSELVWDLLVAKKRGEEQEKIGRAHV